MPADRDFTGEERRSEQPLDEGIGGAGAGTRDSHRARHLAPQFPNL